MIDDKEKILIGILVIIIAILLILLLAPLQTTTKQMGEKLQRGEITEGQYWEWIDNERAERAEYPY